MSGLGNTYKETSLNAVMMLSHRMNLGKIFLFLNCGLQTFPGKYLSFEVHRLVVIGQGSHRAAFLSPGLDGSTVSGRGIGACKLELWFP